MFNRNMKKTLVLGASDNPSRYSNLAIHRLTALDIPVVAVGRKETSVSGVTVHKEPKAFEQVHTITLYLNADHQVAYYPYILSLHPKRIIFNPGAENEELARLARENGIETLEACTLVMLQTGQY
jgi:predicted CoA-binding protein